MSDIVERLRDPTSRWVAFSEPDPLRLEAADEIERLRTERDERWRQSQAMRAALREIAEMDEVSLPSAWDIARAALEGK